MNEPVRGMLFTGDDDSFSTPISVSSVRYGGWLGSDSPTIDPFGWITINVPQLVSSPTGGHSLNGGVGRADARLGTASAPTAAAASAANIAPGRRRTVL